MIGLFGKTLLRTRLEECSLTKSPLSVLERTLQRSLLKGVMIQDFSLRNLLQEAFFHEFFLENHTKGVLLESRGVV